MYGFIMFNLYCHKCLYSYQMIISSAMWLFKLTMLLSIIKAQIIDTAISYSMYL